MVIDTTFESPHIPLLSILTATSAEPHNLLSILTSVLNSSNPFSLYTAVRAIFQNSKYFTRVFLIQIFFLQRLSQSLQFPFFHSPQCDLHSWIWAALAFSECTMLLYHMPSGRPSTLVWLESSKGSPQVLAQVLPPFKSSPNFSKWLRICCLYSGSTFNTPLSNTRAKKWIL